MFDRFVAESEYKYIEHAIVARYDEGVTPSEIYDIDQLRAMRLADAAWQEVDATTIRNCWRKSGILPNMDTTTISHPSIPISALVHDAAHQEDPIAHAEKQVSDALDALVETGALQRCNRTDIEALLNPTDEMELIDETTDDEIFRAVMDAREKRENSEITGSDDVDDPGPVKASPTPSRLFRPSSYTDSINDPIASKLEGLLGIFSRRISLERSRTMKETVMTDYFQSS